MNGHLNCQLYHYNKKRARRNLAIKEKI